MTTAAQGTQLSRNETGELIEAMRWQLDPIRFTPTMARGLSRLAEVHPDAFRALARLLAEGPAWAPLARKLLGNAEHEEWGDWEFGLTMASSIASYEVLHRLEPTTLPLAQLTRLTHHLPTESGMGACRAAAFRRWLQDQSREAGDWTMPMNTPEDREFIAEHLDALMDRADAFRNRAGIDREFLQRVLDLDTAALADGVL